VSGRGANRPGRGRILIGGPTSPSLLSRIDAQSDSTDREPLPNVSAEQTAHVTVCPICRDGNIRSCPVGLALSHALAAAAEASRTARQ